LTLRNKNVMKKVVFYSFLVILASCVSNKKIQKAQRELTKTASKATALPQEVIAKPAVVAIKSRYLLKDSTFVRVFLELDIENLKADKALIQLKENFRFSWLLQPDYGVRDRLAYGKIDITERNTILKEGKILLNFEIPRPKNYSKGLLLTEVFELENSKKSNNDLVIDFNGVRLNDRFGIFVNDFSVPIFKNYISEKDSFQIRSVISQPKEIFLIRYNNEFEPAQSPMATSIRPAMKGLKMEEIIKVQTNTSILLPNGGLYLAVEDTTSNTNGFGFLIVDKRFPRFTRPEKLIKPLIYISSGQETKTVNENNNTKQALDRYFLTVTGGNQMVSKKIIKTYYHRIEDANRLFTTYKEGWKTDKGMVYIVLGPPNRVQRSHDREVWMYAQSQNFSEIIFTFNRKPNQFTENYYELVRYPEYQAYWYPFVEAWRTGNVVE
jgi:GWxTD domain-containing protein